MKNMVLICSVLFLFSCNGDYDNQLKQGVNNWCGAKAVEKQLEQEPENVNLHEQKARLLRYLETNKELSGDAEKFEREIKELTKDC